MLACQYTTLTKKKKNKPDLHNNMFVIVICRLRLVEQRYKHNH